MSKRTSQSASAGIAMVVALMLAPVWAQDKATGPDKDAMRKTNASQDTSASRDPAQLAPEIYKVLLDNVQVRVLEVRLSVGQKSPMHSHPGYVIYCITPGKIRFATPDGKTSDVEFKAGQTLWRDAEAHGPENIGNSECQVLNIELKGSKGSGEHMAAMAKWKDAAGGEHGEHRMIAIDESTWQAAPPGLPPGSQIAVLEGDPSKAGLFAMRAKLPANYKIPPHYHPADEHVTVISGALFMGGGDRLDEGKSKELGVGGFALMPAGLHHFAWTKEETVIQVHGSGSRSRRCSRFTA